MLLRGRSHGLGIRVTSAVLWAGMAGLGHAQVVAPAASLAPASAPAPANAPDTQVDAAAVESLPADERRASGLALLAPGVAPDGGGHGLVSFHGISNTLNNSSFDGTGNTQAFTGQERGRVRLGYSVSHESVQQVRVSESGALAETGASAGGAILTVTRSGTDSLHGRLFLFDRDSDWGAQNPFTNLTEQSTPGVFTAVPTHPRDTRQQWGGTAGGPLRKGRLYGFLAYEGYRRNFPGVARVGNVNSFFNAGLTSSSLATLQQRLGLPLPGMAKQAYQQVLTALAGETGTVSRSAGQWILFPKLDWQLNLRSRLSLEYNAMRGSSEAGVLTAPSETYGIAGFGNSETAEDWLVARWVLSPGAHSVNQLTYSYGRDLQSEWSQPSTPFEQPFSQNVYGRSPQISLLGSSTGLRIGKPATLDRPALPDEQRNEISEKLTLLRGRHALSGGYMASHVSDGINDIYNGTGSYTYDSLVNFASDLLSPGHCGPGSSGVGFFPCYSYFRQSLGAQRFDFATNDYAAFFADTWKARPRLTLSYGVRYDFQQMPHTNRTLANPTLPETMNAPSDRNNFGPRAGFAWDLFGTGRTVLRAAGGLYYGRINNSTIFSALTSTGSANGQLSYYFRPIDEGAPPFPHVFSGQVVVPVPPDVFFFSSRFQNPQVDEAEVSLEQRIGGTAVTASVIASLGHELPNFIDRNVDLTSGQTITYAVSDPEKAGPLPATYTTRFYTGRLNPGYGRVTEIFSETNSRYEAGVFKLSHRLQRLVYLHANYTYAHAADFNQNARTFARGSDILDPADLRAEYAASNFDVRQRVVGAAVLRTPFHAHGWRGALVNGFAAAPVISLQTGLPYSMRTAGAVPSIKFVDELNRTQTLSGLGASINGSGGAKRIALVGRNTYRYPGTIHTNLRLSKTIAVHEHARLECMAEAFNAINHRNVTDINTVGYAMSGAAGVNSLPRLTWEPTFGIPSNANSGAFSTDRQIQLAARLSF